MQSEEKYTFIYSCFLYHIIQNNNVNLMIVFV